MYLGVCEKFEVAQAELFGQGVDACVSEELCTRIIDFGDGGVGFEAIGWAGQAPREIFACVLVLEETANGVDRLIFEGNAALYTRNINHHP